MKAQTTSPSLLLPFRVLELLALPGSLSVPKGRARERASSLDQASPVGPSGLKFLAKEAGTAALAFEVRTGNDGLLG